MKLSRIGLFFLVMWAVGCATTETRPVAPPAAPPVALLSKNNIVFIGHRGAAGEAPENTLAAFRRGLEVGADAIELDVHLSKEDELVVIHDPRLDRTSDGTGLVRDLTLAEISRVNAAAKFKGGTDYGVQRIPTLQQVYDALGSRANIQVEIKVDAQGNRYPGIEQKVIEVVRRNNAVARTSIGSFDFPTLQEVQRLEPQLQRVAFISTAYLGKKGMRAQGPDEIAAELVAVGAQGVGVEKSYLAKPLITAFKQAGLIVGAWTVDDFVEMWNLIDLGVDMITTNRPNLLIEKYRQGRNK
ncbi:MAG: glycerophosphodiester phosphodiesterase family protein [Chloroflexota bacterium]